MDELTEFCRQPPPRQIPPSLKKGIGARFIDHVVAHVFLTFVAAFITIWVSGVTHGVTELMTDVLGLGFNPDFTTGVVIESHRLEDRYVVSFEIKDGNGDRYRGTSSCQEGIEFGTEVPVEVSRFSWLAPHASKIGGCELRHHQFDGIILAIGATLGSWFFLLGAIEHCRQANQNVELLKTGKVVDGQVLSSWSRCRGEIKEWFVNAAFCDGVDERVETVNVNKKRYPQLPAGTLVHVICYPGHRGEALVLEGL